MHVAGELISPGIRIDPYRGNIGVFVDIFLRIFLRYTDLRVQPVEI